MLVCFAVNADGAYACSLISDCVGVWWFNGYFGLAVWVLIWCCWWCFGSFRLVAICCLGWVLFSFDCGCCSYLVVVG